MKLKVTKMSPLQQLHRDCPELAKRLERSLTRMYKKHRINDDVILAVCRITLDAYHTGVNVALLKPVCE